MPRAHLAFLMGSTLQGSDITFVSISISRSTLAVTLLIAEMDKPKVFLTELGHQGDLGFRAQISTRSKSADKAYLPSFNAEHQTAQIAHKDSFQLRQQRLWAALQLKITYPDPGPDYYAHTPFRPGIWFWKDLLSSITPNHKLNLPIPDTLAVFDKYHWASWSNRQISVTTDFSLPAFYHSLAHYREQSPLLAAVLRVPAEGGTKSIPLNWHELGDKAMKSQFPPVCLVQRLLKSHGKRPAIQRIFYEVREKEGKASRGYFISNTKSGMKTIYGETIVVSDIYEGIEAFALTSSSLSPLKSISFQLVSYLQSLFPVRILDISLDFLKDCTDQLWLISCQGFQIDPTIPLSREIQGDQLSSVHCKLCLLAYHAQEVRKTVPFRLLLVYREHTKGTGREIMDLSHLRTISQGFLAHSVCVCDLCYQLILQEYELIHTEIHISRLLNVPFHPDYPNSSVSHQHPNFLPPKLPQWRVLFFFKHIDSNYSPGNIVFSYRFLDFDWKITIKSPHFEVNLARMHYFFADSTVEMVNYIRSLQLFVVLSKPNGDIIASGQCSPLGQFSTILSPETAVTQSINLLLFQNDDIWATLKVEIGLARDSHRNIKELPVDIERIGLVYVPEAAFFTCDCLPEAWIEVFDPDLVGNTEKSDILDSGNELEKCYSPIIDLKKVLCPIKRKRNKRRSVSTGDFRLFIKPITYKSPSKYRFKKPDGRWSESTASTSRVLYHTDSNKLKSPALLSARPTHSRAISQFSCPDMEETADLRVLVQKFMEKRGRS